MLHGLSKRLFTGIFKCQTSFHSVNSVRTKTNQKITQQKQKLTGMMDCERRVVVNPRASGILITNSPKHIKVNTDGIERLKDAVSINSFICLHLK